MASQTIKISVTGHKNLRTDDLSKIKEKVKTKIAILTRGKDKGRMVLYCGTAKGADHLVAEIAIELGIPVTAVLTHEDKGQIIEGISSTKQLPPVYNDKKEIDENGGYEQLGQFLVNNADHLLALWDGVFNGKQGGTSEVVRMAMESNQSMTISHLIIPRISNPYPVATLLPSGLAFNMKKFQRIPFAVHFSWIDLKVESSKKDGRLKSFFKLSKLKLGSSVFLTFILPMILVVVTMILGTLGFRQLGDDFHNALFKAVNLITFNNSIIELNTFPVNESYTKITKVPLILDIARYLGLVTTLTAFFIALYFALGEERKRLKIIWWQRFHANKYVLVLGLGKKSFDLVSDLVSKKFKVAVLAENDDSFYKDEIERLGAVFIEGNISSVKLLRKVYFAKAKEIYILSDSDTANVRAAQELDRLTGKIPSDQKWYAHIQAPRLRTFLHKNLSKYSRHRIHIFDIYQNSARRLQLYHPMDRFYQTPQADEAHVVIFGFDYLGKQIALNALRQGHFEAGKRLQISIFCRDAATKKAQFKNQYSIFKAVDSKQKHLKRIKKNIWPHKVIKFYELPLSDAELFSNKSVLFKDIIHSKHVVSIYSCFEKGMESGAFTATLLPKLNYERLEKKCNLQVFCFYNFPDKAEEELTERNFNKLAPDIPVFCFGNFIDECSLDYIKDLALDALPMQIAYLYDSQVQSKEEVWLNCSEEDKESNRQAADHLWVKLRTAWPAINWQFNPNTFELLAPPVIKEKYEKVLSEIEHRRWSADLLIKGYTPLQEEATSKKDMEILDDRWFKKKEKKIFKDQKLHIDLIPFDDLTESEQKKDLNQVQSIPEFLRAIVQV